MLVEAEGGMPMDEGLLDDIIRRLLDAKNGRTTRQVQLTEPEIRQICIASKEIFTSQPNLLELEAPIKICGKNETFLITIENFLPLLCHS